MTNLRDNICNWVRDFGEKPNFKFKYWESLHIKSDNLEKAWVVLEELVQELRILFVLLVHTWPSFFCFAFESSC